MAGPTLSRWQPNPAIMVASGQARRMVEVEAKNEVGAALERLGLLRAGEPLRFERLTGGVSSDIWLVELERGPVCVKRALPKLRVRQDWGEKVSGTFSGAGVPGVRPGVVVRSNAAHSQRLAPAA